MRDCVESTQHLRDTPTIYIIKYFALPADMQIALFYREKLFGLDMLKHMKHDLNDIPFKIYDQADIQHLYDLHLLILIDWCYMKKIINDQLSKFLIQLLNNKTSTVNHDTRSINHHRSNKQILVKISQRDKKTIHNTTHNF
ncbi:hypothetical protein Bhyg_01848 [Pseudolycoriella hygida]|uniref:Uncharacterized protein n=1 Tax=Pseudolycoriella hygida TaxID=35572 RepID=A0A9Q0NAA0_9DIPT|nr:hypothetical protein Bhyg_01848 [Pseudolycoriella hygida]